MVSAFLRTAFLVAALKATSASTDIDIQGRIAELQHLVKEDEAHLRSLEGRQLLADDPVPSIFGDLPGTRLYTDDESLDGALNHLWLILCGALVMVMQGGFAMMEAGCCRTHAVDAVLLKNLTCAVASGWAWWFFGWSLAYSGPYRPDGFRKFGVVGGEQFLGHTFLKARDDGQQEPTDNIRKWFFSWAVACLATTIVGAALTERVKFFGYLIASIFFSSFIYPVVVASTWGHGYLDKTGYVDFAGSGVIHITGGTAALIGCVIAGPRPFRWEQYDSTHQLVKMTAKQRIVQIPETFNPHSQPLIASGTFLMWFGWYGLNMGLATTNMRNLDRGFQAAQVAMNTSISAAASGLTAFFIRFAMTKQYDVGAMCSGIVAGLVSISAGCANVECGTAFGIGLFGAFVFAGTSAAMRALRVDDPLEIIGVHFACGIWGLFIAGAADWGRGKRGFAHGMSGFRCKGTDVDYARGPYCTPDKAGLLFGANLAEMFSIFAWCTVCSLFMFVPLRLSGLIGAQKEAPEKEKAIEFVDDLPPLKSI